MGRMNKTQLQHLATCARQHLERLDRQLDEMQLRRDEAAALVAQLEAALQAASGEQAQIPDAKTDEGRQARVKAVEMALRARGGTARFAELLRDLQRVWPLYSKNHLSQDLKRSDDKPYEGPVRRGLYRLRRS